MAKGVTAVAAVRCAIYTRKSSEEGLEQEFNSLDAQREACEAYVKSQKAEGWMVLAEMYDDGGISGGTMQRPALVRLLADIEAGKVDAVVVYKVDRLTRSLSDFIKVVEIFDRKGVSFVSVTQQFNTTTSMGRLTLNMLLSFAQFEREVTGERIRDKIAASKKKGMWMGGVAPMGYDVKDRSLVVNPREAETIGSIYRRYAELGSVAALKEQLDQDGITSKVRIDRHGCQTGGQSFSRGALYLMLKNPIYRGKIVHKDSCYPGQHKAIIDEALWDQVQAILVTNRVDRNDGAGVREPSLLAGLVYDGSGERMSPSHASKKGKRYRYYVSQSLIKATREKAPEGLRVPASDIEELVSERLQAFFRDTAQLHAALEHEAADARELEGLIARAHALSDDWASMDRVHKRRILGNLVARIVVRRETIEISTRTARLAGILRCRDDWQKLDERTRDDEPITMLEIPARLRRAGLETRMLIDSAGGGSRGEPDRSLLRLLALAHRYNEMFTRGGRSISEMATEAGVARSYFTRVLRLSFLSPDITRAILSGRHPRELTAVELTSDSRIPVAWEEQRTVLGFNQFPKR